MQRTQPPSSNNLQQQYKRQASFGATTDLSNTTNSPHLDHHNDDDDHHYYYSNELQTVGMRIRQCVDQGFNLLNREKSDLTNASLDNNDNIKNYAGFIVPQYNPTCKTTDFNINNNNINIQNDPNNNTHQDNDENEMICSNGKRKYN